MSVCRSLCHDLMSCKTRMWANAHVICPAEYRWRPLFNTAKLLLTPITRVPCSNAAKTRNQLKFAGVPQTNDTISATSRPMLKFTILQGHVGEILLFNKFFPIVDTCLSCEDIAQRSCTMVPSPDGEFLAIFCVLHFQRAARSTFQTCILNSHYRATPCVEVAYGRHPICDR